MTPYLPHNYSYAQELSRSSLSIVEMYAGLFEIDTDAYTYFAFCKNDKASAPVLLWLQGGPGASSLFGLFTEIGPIRVNSYLQVERRQVWWDYHLLFLDNPLGTGFSFTTHDERMATNESTIGKDLASAVRQFFQLFPELNENDFYVTGESYAGKYIPACAYHLRDNLPNLRGISIGDGAFDPQTQFRGFGELLYTLGMASPAERAAYVAYEIRWELALSNNDVVTAFEIFDEMLNGDFWTYGTFYANTTGMGTNYFNFQQSPNGSSLDADYFIQWLNTTEGRRAMNVGNLPFSVENSTVEAKLKADWMLGVVDYLVTILEDGYKVLIYSGQNDVILGPALTEPAIRNLVAKWRPHDAPDFFGKVQKIIWGLNSDVAGYVHSLDNFTYIVIREAGHMVPTDQPDRAYDMVSRFIDGSSFSV